MPDFASRKEASTSCVLLPMDDTMPIPVTTTRLIAYLFKGSRMPALILTDLRPTLLILNCEPVNRWAGAPIMPAAPRILAAGRRLGLEQADPQVLGLVDPPP